MNKKFYILVSVFALVSMLLASCGGGQPAASEEPKVLRVWIQWGDNPQQIQTLFDKYTAVSGIKVEVTAPLEEDKILPSSPVRNRRMCWCFLAAIWSSHMPKRGWWWNFRTLSRAAILT